MSTDHSDSPEGEILRYFDNCIESALNYWRTKNGVQHVLFACAHSVEFRTAIPVWQLPDDPTPTVALAGVLCDGLVRCGYTHFLFVCEASVTHPIEGRCDAIIAGYRYPDGPRFERFFLKLPSGSIAEWFPGPVAEA